MSPIGKAIADGDFIRAMSRELGDLLASLATPIDPRESGATPHPGLRQASGQPTDFDPNPPSPEEVREAARFKYGF